MVKDFRLETFLSLMDPTYWTVRIYWVKSDWAGVSSNINIITSSLPL